MIVGTYVEITKATDLKSKKCLRFYYVNSTKAVLRRHGVADWNSRYEFKLASELFFPLNFRHTNASYSILQFATRLSQLNSRGITTRVCKAYGAKGAKFHLVT